MSLLSLIDVRKSFGGLSVLAGIDLEVLAGERHAIIGPNGAGKSTLFNMISGRNSPSSGRIVWRGADIAGRPAHKIARLGIGRSFQIINVFPDLTVAENVIGAIVSHLGARWRVDRPLARIANAWEGVERILHDVELDTRRDTPAKALGYGEQRRLEIGLTLATDPVLMLLDEPCAGLNAIDTKTAVDLIRRVSERRTLLMVEHDMNVVFDLADRVSVIYYGRVLATGTPAEVRDNEGVRAAYLGRKASVLAEA